MTVRMNHVNLACLPGGRPEMVQWLTEVLGFRPASMSEAIRDLGACWFDDDDGIQIHLSEDPDHRPAARAHVAFDFGADLAVVAQRLRDAKVDVTPGVNPEVEVLVCVDPAGNLWELRGRSLS